MISAVLHDSYCVNVQHTNNIPQTHIPHIQQNCTKCVCNTSENVLVKMRVIPEVLLLWRHSPSGAKVWDVAHVSERAPVRIMFVRELCMCVCVCRSPFNRHQGLGNTYLQRLPPLQIVYNWWKGQKNVWSSFLTLNLVWPAPKWQTVWSRRIFLLGILFLMFEGISRDWWMVPATLFQSTLFQGGGFTPVTGELVQGGLDKNKSQEVQVQANKRQPLCAALHSSSCPI